MITKVIDKKEITRVLSNLAAEKYLDFNKGLELVVKNRDRDNITYFKSDNYNMLFDKTTGLFYRWGKDFKEDPEYSPYGPEILDLEISSGKCSGNCPFCYKDNGKHHEDAYNMSLNEFKVILNSMPETLTQIAFGICDVDTNPHFIDMMKHSKEKGIIPNFTCNGLKITKDFAEEVSKICGACAVSIVNKQDSYNAIKYFTDAGMDQVNTHFMLSEETYDKAFEIIDDICADKRLSKMNAVVFLQYKHKNKKSPFHSMLSKEKYRKLVDYCEDRGIGYGFDSCSANLFIDSMKGHSKEEQFKLVSEPCESTLFSSYINVHGDFYPCSFSEGEGNWGKGISVLGCTNFLKDVWLSSRVNEFRNKLIKNKRNCPIYKI